MKRVDREEIMTEVARLAASFAFGRAVKLVKQSTGVPNRPKQIDAPQRKIEELELIVNEYTKEVTITSTGVNIDGENYQTRDVSDAEVHKILNGIPPISYFRKEG